MHAEFIRRLATLIGESAVLTGPDMDAYLTDWRGRYTGNARCVVKPATTEEVAAVVALCAAESVPMVPQGGNTGLCGGATCDESGRAVVINLSRMNRIRDIDPENNTLTVEAGCVLQQVQGAAEQVNRLFPLSLASEGSCQIGGNLSTNAGGVNVLRYGNMRDLVLGIEAVLPDGRIWSGLRGLRKDNTGYDLKQLFMGAEGTLGIITAAVLKLYPRPRASATAWVAVRDPATAVALLARLQSLMGERVTAFELVSDVALNLVLQHIPGARNPLAGTFAWTVLIEVTDTLVDAGLAEMLEEILADEMQSGHVLDAVVAHDIASQKRLWNLRESISEAQRLDGVSIKHDIAVPVSRIPAFIDQADSQLGRAFPAIRIVTFGHIGDGNLHYNLSKPNSMENADFIKETAATNKIVHDIVASLGGSISAEHGIGQLKRAELLRYKSEVEMDLMHAIKRTLDPHSLMNPGKIL